MFLGGQIQTGQVNDNERIQLMIRCKVLRLETFKYLLFQLLSKLLGLALLVVVHNHHGGIDLPDGHVTG